MWGLAFGVKVVPRTYRQRLTNVIQTTYEPKQESEGYGAWRCIQMPSFQNIEDEKDTSLKESHGRYDMGYIRILIFFVNRITVISLIQIENLSIITKINGSLR